MREWESDPLFAAAEVVQDSADRLESIFRLLFHEQSLVHEDHVDQKLLSSIEYHRRDLATTLETAKWQLEDFEREVATLAVADNSWKKQHMIARHEQFIGAIREQIVRVEKSMDKSMGNSLRNMNLNEQDRDGLALFLSGGKPAKEIRYRESEDDDNLRRFLDPAVSSSSKEDINEQKVGEVINVNEIEYLDQNMEVKDNYLTQLDLRPSSSVQEADCLKYNEEEIWDLEANETKGKSNLQKNKPRNYYGFWSLGKFISIHRFMANRSFMKRIKDGEEQRQYPLGPNVHPSIKRYLAQLRSACGSSRFNVSCPRISAQVMQSHRWITDHIEKCHRSLLQIQVRNHPLLFILLVLSALLFLSILLVF